ncbi:hypothetical protein GALMADRAFT_283623 [Galerina marginata CBS 339.88]|uniref:Serine protease inhibitor n=1 Tax=Galerina marginata (strain CBS 339.88) TaxID=685588 RepID=A0A067SHU3_GALM3|nr:hypothetical protein GALMADRAFT_283623 [Galerina marginata CBS 339.88]
MALQNGSYTITSKAGAFPVGRNKAEDRSLNPKKVVLLPQGIESPEWIVEALADGTYILKIGGRPTANIDELLFAVLLDEPEPTKWKVNPQFHQGENTYTITPVGSDNDGWQVPADAEVGTQIAIQPLKFGRSFPPTYTPEELFVITKVD